MLLINPDWIHAVDNQGSLPSRLLSELEVRLVSPDEVLIATADLEAGEAQLAQQRNRQGWKLFAGAGTGLTNDTALSGDDRRYTTYDLRAGVRHPLLGRADAEQRSVIEAQTSVLEKEQRLQLARRQGLSLLRQSYVGYWAAQEKLRLSQAFLAGESRQRERFTQRQQAGYLLEADRLEFISAFDLARRDRENLGIAQRSALHAVQRLTATSDVFSASPPDSMIPPADLDGLPQAAMDSSPSVVLLRKRLQGLEQQIPLMRRADTNANLDLYTAAGVDDAQNSPEYSVGVNLSIELPVGTLGGGEYAAQQSARALATKCRRELAFERDTVRARVEEVLALYRASEADILFAARRLQAAAERVRENRLRTALEGDSLEQLQQSRFTYYQGAMDAVDAQARQWNYLAALLEYTAGFADTHGKQRPAPAAAVTKGIDLSFLSDGPPAKRKEKNSARQKAPAEPAARLAAGVNSLYVWQSMQFRSRSETDPDFLPRLQAAGVQRVLLSLNQEQIDALIDPSGRAAFADWLGQLHGRGIKVELLLGEPSWILPEHRSKLLKIITSLADLSFSGLHLDLEPDQLAVTEGQGEALLKEWIASVEAAKKASPWPLGVSMHPRYFQTKKNAHDLGTILTRLGVSEVTLMVYVSNPDRVAQVVQPMLKRTPGIRFSVAQSVEPELPVQESHYRAGRAQFAARMSRLAGLINAPNFAGLVVQDWIRWQEMKP
jgi:outer membrane protein TolC